MATAPGLATKWRPSRNAMSAAPPTSHIEWLSSSVQRLRGTVAENRASISAVHAEILADAEIGRYIHRTTCGVK